MTRVLIFYTKYTKIQKSITKNNKKPIGSFPLLTKHLNAPAQINIHPLHFAWRTPLDVWAVHKRAWWIRKRRGAAAEGDREAAAEGRQKTQQGAAQVRWAVHVQDLVRHRLHLAPHVRQTGRGLGLPRAPRHHHGLYQFWHGHGHRNVQQRWEHTRKKLIL